MLAVTPPLPLVRLVLVGEALDLGTLGLAHDARRHRARHPLPRRVDDGRPHGRRRHGQRRAGRRGRADDVLEDFNFTAPLQEQDPPVGLFNADLVLPGKNGELFSRKGETVSRETFYRIMDDYYAARGWDVVTGLPFRKKLIDLDLEDIVAALAENGLLI